MSDIVNLHESISIAMFLVTGMSMAGFVHVGWLKWAESGFLTRPIDMGRTFRGHRIFGDNKQLRGFMVMPLASAVVFALLGSQRDELPQWLAVGMWEMSTGRYALLGASAGFVFIFAELPNSFIKRQLRVPPGEIPAHGWGRALCLTLDRLDSVLGVLVVVSLLVPTPILTWIWLLAIGPLVHTFFSGMLYWLGIKARAL